VPARVTALKAATPLTAVLVRLPPKVPPVPLLIATVTTVLLSVVTVLPY
jgi:hypothetical protein